MQFIRTLIDIALKCSLPEARSFLASVHWFLASVHWELSVALVQSQGYVCHRCSIVLAMVAGRQMLPLEDSPYLD
jgi:hypothetical protein